MVHSDTIQITPEILGLIAKIDEFKGAWRAQGALALDRLTALRHVAMIESIGSSTRINGSKLSDREIEHLLSNHSFRAFATQDEQEIAGYAKVLDQVFSSWQDIPPTESRIQQLHRDLLIFSEKDEGHRATYKTSSNSIPVLGENGAQLGVVFETATPFDTPGLMTELVAWMQDECQKARLHPLLLIGLWVVVFLEIHPFQDGNGRLSRVLTTLLLLRAGYAYVPYSSLESVIEQNSEAYHRALHQTQKTIRSEAPDWQPWLQKHRPIEIRQMAIRTETPNWQPWLVFFLRSLAEQVQRLTQKVEREQLMLAPLPELSMRIIEFAREHGRVTMGNLIRLTGISRNTLKQHFRALVEQGRLRQRGGGRGVWYELH